MPRRGRSESAPSESNTDGAKRSKRQASQGKPSELDTHAGTGLPVPGAPALTYSLGGVDVGGSDVLREVEVDDNLVAMRGQFAQARRIVLMHKKSVVAAAIVEVQHAPSFSGGTFLDIPILAAARHGRQRGYGTALHALICELGSMLGIGVVVVCATDESRRFWQRQGYHATAHCEPAVAAALRALSKSGMSDGFQDTLRMARALPEVRTSGELVRAALDGVSKGCAPKVGLGAAELAQALGYEDVSNAPHMLFVADEATGKRAPPETMPKSGGPPALKLGVVPSRLQGFSTSGMSFHGVPPPSGWGDPGWGLRSTVAIDRGAVVCELGGELLSEMSYAALADKRFCAALDEAAHRRAPLPRQSRGAPLPPAYVDMRTAGSIARCARACIEAPNLELVVTAASRPDAPDPSPTGGDSAAPERAARDAGAGSSCSRAPSAEPPRSNEGSNPWQTAKALGEVAKAARAHVNMPTAASPPPQPQQLPPPPQLQKMRVVVPPGILPGQSLQVRTVSGGVFQCTVPPNAMPGTTLEMMLPVRPPVLPVPMAAAPVAPPALPTAHTASNTATTAAAAAAALASAAAALAAAGVSAPSRLPAIPPPLVTGAFGMVGGGSARGQEPTAAIQERMHAVRQARLAREQERLTPAAHLNLPPKLPLTARRAYLVARHDIPPHVELTWDPLPKRKDPMALLDLSSVRYDASLVGQRVLATFLDEDGAAQWYPALIVGYRPKAAELKFVIHFDEDGEEIEADLPDGSVQLLAGRATHCHCPTCTDDGEAPAMPLPLFQV